MSGEKRRAEAGSASFFETPGGWGGVVASARGLVAVVMPAPGRTRDDVAAEVESTFPGAAGEDELTRRGGALLARYYAGERVSFDLPVDESRFTAFQRDVYRAVARIGYGTVKSYAEVAQEIGRPRAARGVGTAMARNPLPIVIPCHRVVGRSGALTGYSAPGGVATKRALLHMEGALKGKGDGQQRLR